MFIFEGCEARLLAAKKSVPQRGSVWVDREVMPPNLNYYAADPHATRVVVLTFLPPNVELSEKQEPKNLLHRECRVSRVQTLFLEPLKYIGRFRILGAGGTESVEANCQLHRSHRR